MEYDGSFVPCLESHALSSLLSALGDPHEGREDEHQRGPQHGAAKAHHEPEVRQEDSDRCERCQKQGRSYLTLGLRGFLVIYNMEGIGVGARGGERMKGQKDICQDVVR